ncbi:hypothetical protein [Nocardioides sp. SYSU DS0663]|uniref:hypothetical protein n=1 Tax=Nocardioides sp. SYSU DS0663 TaxID=3416445 RepID=UPI003F4BF376
MLPLPRLAHSDDARATDEFDAFYKHTRERLLVQTWALTGDLTAARSAVRHTFVVAWHHWPKVARGGDPEAWARPHAWSYAQRRHTARLGHRDKDLAPEVRATLDALADLPLVQRRLLVLSAVAPVPLEEMAREVGLPAAAAERELQQAATRFSAAREVGRADIGLLLAPLAAAAADVRWPRPSIVRRSGSARRRAHTTAGVVATVAALVVSGAVVSDGAGVRPTLDRATMPAAQQSTPTEQPAEPVPPLATEALLTAGQVGSNVDGRRWRIRSTDGNTEGDGRVLPCQADRYADPAGRAALLRTFEATAGGGPRRTAGQLAESSRSDRAARRTYRRALGWYASCDEGRTQLLGTRRVDRVGDEATLFTLRDWGRPVRTTVVGVARTGRVTTTTTYQVRGDARPDVGGGARLLADAVDALCAMPDAGSCAGRPTARPVRPLPVGEVPSLLSEVDLPPVRDVRRPWTGTPAVRAHQNPAATPCDRTSFRGGGTSRDVTRTFVVLEAGLPPEFGLSETAAALPARKGQAFVDAVRRKMDRCADDDLTTEVRRLAQTDGRREDLGVWAVSTEVSEDTTVRYLVAIARADDAVAQLGFVPAGARTMSDSDFIGLARRALERLHEHPAPRRG